MQIHVTKQSLALIGVSILLTISICITSTFAVFHDTKQVAGYISFIQPNLVLELTGTTNYLVSDGDINFSIDQDDFESADYGKMKLKSSVQQELKSIGYSIYSSTANEFTWQVTCTISSALSELGLITLNSDTVAKKLLVESVNSVTGTSGVLGNFISFNPIYITRNLTAETDYFTISFSASYGDNR